MPNIIPDDTQIGNDDVQLMARLGVPSALIRILLRDAGLSITDRWLSSGTNASPRLSPTEEDILRSGGASGLVAGVTDTSASRSDYSGSL
jgi:hypothetical protein